MNKDIRKKVIYLFILGFSFIIIEPAILMTWFFLIVRGVSSLDPHVSWYVLFDAGKIIIYAVPFLMYFMVLRGITCSVKQKHGAEGMTVFWKKGKYGVIFGVCIILICSYISVSFLNSFGPQPMPLDLINIPSSENMPLPPDIPVPPAAF